MSKLLLLAIACAAVTLGAPMAAQADSHPDRAISYDAQLEPTPTPSSPAGPVSKQLWHSTRYDTMSSTLAGFPIVAVGEDDYNEWSSLLYGENPYAVLGFTMVYASPSSPYYHHIFLARAFGRHSSRSTPAGSTAPHAPTPRWRS